MRCRCRYRCRCLLVAVTSLVVLQGMRDLAVAGQCFPILMTPSMNRMGRMSSCQRLGAYQSCRFAAHPMSDGLCGRLEGGPVEEGHAVLKQCSLEFLRGCALPVVGFGTIGRTRSLSGEIVLERVEDSSAAGLLGC